MALKEFPIPVHVYKTAPRASGGTLRLAMRVQPGRRPDAPLLYVVHGGGWNACDSSEVFMYPAMTEALTADGWAIAAVDYRLVGTPDDTHFDEMFTDILDGLEWLAVRRGPFRFDPGRVVVMGTSAGGHLALMTGLAGRTFRPHLPVGFRLIVDHCGPTDLTDLSGFADNPFVGTYRGMVEALAGAPLAPAQYAAFRRISPYHYLTPQSPPILMLHGTADTIVPFQQSQKLAERCLSLGVPHCLLPITHAGHDMEQSELAGLAPRPSRDAALRCAAAWARAYAAD